MKIRGDKKIEIYTKLSIHLAIHPSDNLSIKVYIHTVNYPKIHLVRQTSIRIVSHLSKHPSIHQAIHNSSSQPTINQTKPSSRHSSYNTSAIHPAIHPSTN